MQNIVCHWSEDESFMKGKWQWVIDNHDVWSCKWCEFITRSICIHLNPTALEGDIMPMFSSITQKDFCDRPRPAIPVDTKDIKCIVTSWEIQNIEISIGNVVDHQFPDSWERHIYTVILMYGRKKLTIPKCYMVNLWRRMTFPLSISMTTQANMWYWYCIMILWSGFDKLQR